ncbi:MULTISPECIES: ATP-binding protein [unclassified Streptomyces]|uniref:ATP-binding protein n=1 Tax=unclassified Streptomyces TaxID=2593676 RepID=UPI002E80F56E|nr:ATP-binding protein [Streptomyces sp. NBC_00589]WTI36767.1 ATP-binding protein [Streptomyces sp. NBC_00775]WUB29557.1 ATP-binding protein [Streptomyces sp. NBC_00589]
MPEIAPKALADFPLDPPDADWEYSLRIPHSPLGPGIVRAHVRAVLSRYRVPEVVLDSVELVASELVTNSLACTWDPVGVRLGREGGRLRLSVWDSNPFPPRESPGTVADLDAESGRGLWLLRECADDWGHYRMLNGRRMSGGKEVWAEWRASCG